MLKTEHLAHFISAWYKWRYALASNGILPLQMTTLQELQTHDTGSSQLPRSTFMHHALCS